MATVCYINIYDITYDRGVRMGKNLFLQYEIDEAEIIVGQGLPHWNDSIKNVPLVTFFDGKRLDLTFRDELFSIKAGEEVMLSEGISMEPEAAQWGIQTIIQHYVKLIG